MSTNKLKWYDWDGVGEIPQGVVIVKYRHGGQEAIDSNSKIDWELLDMSNDIIAYTLGEPLEGGE